MPWVSDVSGIFTFSLVCHSSCLESFSQALRLSQWRFSNFIPCFSDKNRMHCIGVTFAEFCFSFMSTHQSFIIIFQILSVYYCDHCYSDITQWPGLPHKMHYMSSLGWCLAVIVIYVATYNVIPKCTSNRVFWSKIAHVFHSKFQVLETVNGKLYTFCRNIFLFDWIWLSLFVCM